MFATTLLACDMGGYPLAMQLAENPAVGNYAGLILGTMMGPTIVFTIPVALSIIKQEDRPFLGAGILAGLITVPIGCIVGGLVMNLTPYKMDVLTILRNLIPVIIIAGLICVGLWFIPSKMIRGFNKFGTAVTVLITVFTAIAVFEYQTGILFPVMDIMVTPDADGVIPLESGLLVCGQIAIVLIGAFPRSSGSPAPLARLSRSWAAQWAWTTRAQAGYGRDTRQQHRRSIHGEMNPRQL